MAETRACTAFAGHRCLASGPLAEVALAVKAAGEADRAVPILVFDDATGRVIDLDLRGDAADILARLSRPAEPERQAPPPGEGSGEGGPRGRGRPKLGVVAREVTLLPRHWEWLAAQPGGASQALRRLVDEARRADAGQGRKRAAREAAYRFMSAIAGNLAGYEAAIRALFGGASDDFDASIMQWPRDIATYARRLATGSFNEAGT